MMEVVICENRRAVQLLLRNIHQSGSKAKIGFGTWGGSKFGVQIFRDNNEAITRPPLCT